MNLPSKIEYNPFESKQKWELDQKESQLQEVMYKLRDLLQHNFYVWDKDPEFKFVFPQSSFTQLDKPLISYHQPGNLDDNQIVRPLSDIQLKDIKQSGTFLVESNFYTIPYKWKLNTWIYKGYDNRVLTFYKDLSLCFIQIYELPQRFVSNFISVKKGAIRILKVVPNLLNVIIGMRKVYKQQPNYDRMIQKIRSSQSYNTVTKRQLYQYLYVPLLKQIDYSNQQYKEWIALQKEYQNKVSGIRKIDTEFMLFWNQNKKTFIKELQNMDEKNISDSLLKVMLQQRLKFIRKHFRQDQSNILESLLYYINNYSIVITNLKQFSIQLEKSRTDYQAQIQENYKVMKYCNKWKQRKMQSKMKAEQIRLKRQIINKIQNQVKDSAFTKYCEIVPDEHRLNEIKAANPPTMLPNRQFRCPYKLFPPYQIQTVPSTTGISYILVKQKDITVSTTYPAWKIVLYLIRWYTWTRNVVYWLFRGLWGGRLGIKVLLFIKPFYPRYAVNSTTGQLIRSQQILWVPIIGQFCLTWMSIKDDRRQFQQAPDNGFFGKVCARIFNVIYNYLIRTVLYMFLWLLFLKPLIIILNVTFLFISGVTAIVWIPIVLIIYGLWNMLIYNFDLDDKNDLGQRVSERFFPLLMTFLKLVYDFAYTIIAFLGIIYHPLLALLFLIWALVRITVKTVVDFIMLGFIKCCGRSPVRDTNIAWRVSGPGLSRDYYQTIKQSDVYILFLAEIQKLHILFLQKNYQRCIREIKVEPMEYVNNILKPFDMRYIQPKEIQQSILYYTQKLQNQVERQLKKYPYKPGPNVRFSKTELEKYLVKSHQILLDYISTHGSQFIIKQFSLSGDEDTEQLMYKIWIAVFGTQQIFEPFQDLDHRFQLVNDREDDAIKKVLKAIQGEVDFKQKIPALKFLRMRKIQQKTIITVGEMIDIMNRYRQRQFGNSKTNIQEGLFINYNIKDLQIQENNKAVNMEMNNVSFL